MGAALYLNTRGRERHRDYQFVGPAPPRSWWRAYADHTSFERPTVLVQSDGRDWQAYLSGIPSRRRDAVGTVIRYTLVAEGGADRVEAGGPASGDILALVATWLADQESGRRGGQVGDALDAAFPEPDVERLLAADPDPAAAEVRRRLDAALRELRLPAAVDAPETAADWLGDTADALARATFVQQVDALLAGRPGRALELNLVGSAADLAALLADPRPLAVLAPDLPAPSTITPLHRTAGEPAKKAEPPPRTSSSPAPAHPAANLRGCLRLILVPIALIVALVLALFGTIFYPR
jgi:hypothetical protein